MTNYPLERSEVEKAVCRISFNLLLVIALESNGPVKNQRA